MTLTLHTATTVKDAAAALASPGTRYMGGGTLTVRAANEGDISVSTLVRATDPVLSAIDVAGSTVTLGASVTMSAIARHAGLAPLHKVANAIGGPAIRNMATVGGNLFAPSPYGDFAVALLALDATVHLGDGDMPIEDFLGGREKLAKGTIVKAVSFNLSAHTLRFLKVSRVKPRGVSVLSIAAVIEMKGATVARARIAYGSMADRPIRARAAETALAGKALTREGIAAALSRATDGADAPTDAIASGWYRTEVLPVHLGRLLMS
jgi:CO/xanthine dehydrogenase FAD-binding subunit